MNSIAAGHLTVVYSTREAMHQPVGADLCAVLHTRGGLHGHDAEAVEIALHEAVANAVQHGNLELDSRLRRTAAGQAAYARLLAQRLDDPWFGNRSIHIHASWQAGRLTVSVIDEGPGYAPPPAEPAMPAASACSGRGLMLIRGFADMVEVLADGRCLRMEFRVAPGIGNITP